jgi:hypothetical protein
MEQRHLWLDLESTIITPVLDGWWNTHLVNTNKIKGFIEGFQPDHINIFSFAIWDDDQLRKFNEGTRPMIEQFLDRELNIVLRVDQDIIPACCDVMKLHKSKVDFKDMSDFWNKHQAFRLTMFNRHKKTWSTTGVETKVALLDDVVINEHFVWTDLHVTGSIINIDTGI